MYHIPEKQAFTEVIWFSRNRKLSSDFSDFLPMIAIRGILVWRLGVKNCRQISGPSAKNIVANFFKIIFSQNCNIFVENIEKLN